MKKKTLYLIADIERTVRNSMYDLYNDYLDLLNITQEEKEQIEESIMVTMNKLDSILSSHVNELDEHIEIDYLERANQ